MTYSKAGENRWDFWAELGTLVNSLRQEIIYTDQKTGDSPAMAEEETGAGK